MNYIEHLQSLLEAIDQAIHELATLNNLTATDRPDLLRDLGVPIESITWKTNTEGFKARLKQLREEVAKVKCIHGETLDLALKDVGSFGWALQHMKAHKCVRRRGWRLAGMHLGILKTNGTLKVDLPPSGQSMLIPIKDMFLITLPPSDDNPSGYSYPLQPNMHDLMAMDWEICEPNFHDVRTPPQKGT